MISNPATFRAWCAAVGFGALTEIELERLAEALISDIQRNAPSMTIPGLTTSTRDPSK